MRVPGFIPTIDGVHGILFHVEHSEGSEWFSRWRITGPVPSSYSVWREQTNRTPFIRIASEIPGAEVIVEWRATPDSPWLPASLITLSTPTCSFRVRSEIDLEVPLAGFTVCSPMRDDGVAAYHFPAMPIRAGTDLSVIAMADAPAWPNVILAPEDFRPRLASGLSITAEAPSSASWHLSLHAGPFRLSPCPHSTSRRWWALGAESVSPDLLPAKNP